MTEVTTPQSHSLSHASRIHGGWLGKSIGGTLGLPAEGRMERLSFTFYDPIPTIAPPNDDLELQLVWLHLVEKAGDTLTAADFARGWLDHIHYMWDEYGRCRWNLRRGVPAESAGIFENHFQSGMGSPIRSEIWACLFPDDPDSAAHYAALDASLDHGLEGIAGEVLFAVMQSLALSGASVTEAISQAMRYIPAGSETAQAVELVRHCHAEGIQVWKCWEQLLTAHGNENFTHAPLNVALTIWALLYGDEDFERSILLAVNGGYDTDCTAATVGATLGFIIGTEGIPSKWIAPVGEGIFVGAGIQNIPAPVTLKELTQRVMALEGKLKKVVWDSSILEEEPPIPALTDLPGTIYLEPLDGSEPVAWANGELPANVKAAGGAAWIWQVAADEAPREIICLARAGARLFLDGELVLGCRPDSPYVPATHRSPQGTRITVNPNKGIHSIRFELDSKDPGQSATVILAYPNLHIAPWTLAELPDAANLPDA